MLHGIRGTTRKIFEALMHPRMPYFSKPFIYALIVSAIVIFVSLTYGASRGNQVEIEVANQTLTEFQNMTNRLTWLSIFINNMSLALLTFIPLIGTAWMIYVQYNTGWYLGVIAKAYSVDYLMATSIILTNLVGLIEYSASIIAVGESLILTYSATQGDFKERLIHHSFKSIIIVAVMFFAGGVVEASLLGRL